MDNNLNNLLLKHKLDLLYSNNLYSVKSICKELGIWENYTDDEKFKLENLTERDSKINKNFTYKGKYNQELAYGEIQRESVDEIISKINKYKGITAKDVFLDIGSGAGKLVTHLSMVSNFKTLVGVEVIKERYLYSKKILNSLEIADKNIFFINKDIRDFDVSMATVVYINDNAFSESLSNNIIQRLTKGTHILSFRRIDELKFIKDIFPVSVSWTDAKHNLNYYIK